MHKNKSKLAFYNFFAISKKEGTLRFPIKLNSTMELFQQQLQQ
jgi:hypothetical protein